MDRRSFLRALGFGTVAAAAASTSVLDLERMLWVPGEKTIILPALTEYGSVTAQWIVMEAARLLKQNLAMVGQVQRAYDTDWPAKIGTTVKVQMPGALKIFEPMIVTDQLSVSVAPVVGRKQMRTQVIAPAMAILANSMQRKGIVSSVPLELPRGVGESAQATSPDSGISIRYVQSYDMEFDRDIARFDIAGVRE